MTTSSHDPNHQNSDGNPPEMLLPYAEWIENAYRQVMVNAFKFVAHEGLPGNHHFYITFLTTYPGVDIPARLLAQYPQEMTIVLQHQFWDMQVDEKKGLFSVGLSFGGIASLLTIPLGAITAFADPAAQLALAFHPINKTEDDVSITDFPSEKIEHSSASLEYEKEGSSSQVIRLDQFRKRD